MVVYDEKREAYRVVISTNEGGKRIRKVKLLPMGGTREAAQRHEMFMLDPTVFVREGIEQMVKNSNAAPGHVYALRNELMPGIVKIGMTNSTVNGRVANLSTSMPIDFEVVYSIEVNHALPIEQYLHSHFGKHRVKSGREFFRVAEIEVIAAFNIAYQADGWIIKNHFGRTCASSAKSAILRIAWQISTRRNRPYTLITCPLKLTRPSRTNTFDTSACNHRATLFYE